jgi:peptidoglycan/LPS O-acetylase OafA/YrhL
MSIQQITYRKDIDGLRALAILLVICYHTFPNIFNGGFVGVDIFFVISGFLITRIILENLERNSFSFIEFYSRRIRRLFPALFLILLTCLVFGWFALYASEYKRLSEHVAAGTGFFQNFVLMKEIGYFEKSIDTKPLVHLWSLSIEEQFYICWPVILWVLFKKKLNITGFLLFFLGVSLLVNIITTQQNQITTFYYPLSRCWELIIGAVWASMLFKDPKIGNFSINTLNILSLTGLLLLLIAVFTIDGTKLFPGYWALLPTLGAIFLIAANENGVVNRTLLTHPLITWFGQISYPLYLWHWILLSFGQIITANKLAGLEKIILISCSFVLAYLTNRYWENLLRYKGNKVTLCLLIGVIFIGLQGWNFY